MYQVHDMSLINMHVYVIVEKYLQFKCTDFNKHPTYEPIMAPFF